VAFPQPGPGLVVRYSYLWRAEKLAGFDEGAKGRPCAVILVTADVEGRKIVTVLPITHSPPFEQDNALEIPQQTKRRLGLDAERSWVVLTEANRFAWPGPDLRPVTSRDAGDVAFGVVPEHFYERIRSSFVAMLRAGRVRVVERDD
jgi:hypothetical protein